MGARPSGEQDEWWLKESSPEPGAKEARVCRSHSSSCLGPELLWMPKTAGRWPVVQGSPFTVPLNIPGPSTEWPQAAVPVLGGATPPVLKHISLCPSPAATPPHLLIKFRLILSKMKTAHLSMREHTLRREHSSPPLSDKALRRENKVGKSTVRLKGSHAGGVAP